MLSGGGMLGLGLCSVSVVCKIVVKGIVLPVDHIAELFVISMSLALGIFPPAVPPTIV